MQNTTAYSLSRRRSVGDVSSRKWQTPDELQQQQQRETADVRVDLPSCRVTLARSPCSAKQARQSQQVVSLSLLLPPGETANQIGLFIWLSWRWVICRWSSESSVPYSGRNSRLVSSHQVASAPIKAPQPLDANQFPNANLSNKK